MVDEFIQYTQQGIHPSTTGNSYRVWGLDNRKNKTVKPIGITFHWKDHWSGISPGGRREKPRISKLESLSKVANRNDIPLIWVGEQNVNYRNAAGSVEIGKIEHVSGEKFNTDLLKVEIDDLAEKIQSLLDTDLKKTGAAKKKNLTSNSFRDYTSKYLPSQYTIIDFDVFVEKNNGEPFSMTEIKRTRKSPKYWTPWSDDWNNYYLQIAMCEEADMEPIMINHEKQFVDDDYKVGFYYNLERPPNPNINSDKKFMNYDIEYIEAKEARRRLREADLDF